MDTGQPQHLNVRLSKRMSRLLYICPAGYGGVAAYAARQADALAALGVDVTFVAPADFSESIGLPVRRVLRADTTKGIRSLRRASNAAGLLLNTKRVIELIESGSFQHVLNAAYYEYLAPIWAPGFRKLAARGVCFGAIVHDPVRDRVVGPAAWHRRSVAAAYSFLRQVFVHDEDAIAEVPKSPERRITVVPHGPSVLPQPRLGRDVMRQRLGIRPDASVMLAFGHIRDSKNLDLVLRSMAEAPGPLLIVAGRQLSHQDRPLAWYREFAESLGIADRCRWLEDYVPEDQVADLFEAADIVLTTYSGGFRSASSILSFAVGMRKPCLASSGASNLRTVVQQYGLGLWVEPDSTSALVEAIRGWQQASSIRPEWERYEAENSWARNAALTASAMFGWPADRRASATEAGFGV